MALIDNLVAYYKLDGNSNDSVGSNNGTDTSITYSAGNGKIGQGAGFNGSSRISLPSGAYISATAFSLSAWIKISSNPASAAQVLTSDSDANRRWQFGVNPEGTIRFIRFNDANSVISNFNSTGTVTNNTWHHIVAVFDNSVGSKIYINGTQDGSDAVTTSNKITSGTVAFGSQTNTTPLEYFTGSIDEGAIYSRALSALEVTSLYNGGAGLTYPFVSNQANFLAFF